MNNICLIGRLVKDPELRNTTSGTAVCNFTLAVDRRFKKEGQPEADFIPIVTWAKTAEFVGKYFTKGLRVSVIGSLQVRSWDDKEGNKRYATEVISNEVGFADGKKGESGGNVQSQENNYDTSGIDDDSLPF